MRCCMKGGDLGDLAVCAERRMKLSLKRVDWGGVWFTGLIVNCRGRMATLGWSVRL